MSCPAEVLVTPEELQRVAKDAADQAVADAEELMEAVMKETIRLLRSELEGEVKQVADATKKLESACVRTYQLKGHEVKLDKAQEDFQKAKQELQQQLSDCVKAQEELKKEVATCKEQITGSLRAQGESTAHEEVRKQAAGHARQLAGFLKAQDELKKEVADHKGQLASSLTVQRDFAAQDKVKEQVTGQERQLAACFKALEELKKEVADHKVQLATPLSQEAKPQVQVSHEDLACIKDQTADLKKTVAEDMQGVQAKVTEQLNFAVKEKVDKPIANLAVLCEKMKDDIVKCLNTENEDKRISELQAQMKAQNSKEQLVEIGVQIKELHTKLSQHSLQQESTLSELRGHKDHVDKKISELQIPTQAAADVSEAKIGCSNEEFLEMKSELQKLQTQLSGINVPTEGIQNQSDLEVIKNVDKQISDLQAHLSKIKGEQEASLTELRGHIETTKQNVNKQTSDLQSHLSLMKGKHEASFTELRGHGEAAKENVNKQISDLHSHVSEIKEHLAQRSDKSDAVTRADLDGMREFLLGQMGPVSESVQDLRKLADGFHPEVQKELKALNGHVADIRKQSTQSDAQVELQQVQRNMNAHLHELREVVDKLVKGSSKGGLKEDDLKVKMATLEHDMEELRSEASSLRLAFTSEEHRAAEAKKKAMEEGVFCKFFM